MPEVLAHGRGRLGIAGIGWVAEVENFTVTATGDPEQLAAIEGTVGYLDPMAPGCEIAGTVFIPKQTNAAYNKIYDSWAANTRLEAWAHIGNILIASFGKFNAPVFTENGTRLDFTLQGEKPRKRNL
jgi:hypothetical protein